MSALSEMLAAKRAKQYTIPSPFDFVIKSQEELDKMSVFDRARYYKAHQEADREARKIKELAAVIDSVKEQAEEIAGIPKNGAAQILEQKLHGTRASVLIYDDIQDAEVVEETPRTPSTSVKPYTFNGNLEPILSLYPTLAAAKADLTLWRALNLSQRLKLGHLYRQQLELAAVSLNRSFVETEQEIRRQERAESAGEEAHVSETAVEEKAKTFALDITLNDRQALAVDYARAGKSFVLTGAAGTGKTLTCREIAKAFIKTPELLGTHNFRISGAGYVSAPGIAFCSYTRRATANIRRALHADASLEETLLHNVVTIHKLLEFEPVFFTNPETGKDTMRFEPKRTASNPLSVRVLVIEEGSMLGLDLWQQLFDALPRGVIIVFVGDINQLPPVFGKSIMNYALAQLPIVELTEVYRQALDSGIIVNAHRILKGLALENNHDTQIVVGNSKTKAGQEKTARALGSALFPELWKKGEYDPELDIILSPWNKQALGTNNLNSWISQFLGEAREAMVNEVFAGRRTMYLAVGDRVMYEKRDGVIKSISHNGSYLGRIPQPAGTDLTRFGVRKIGTTAAHESFDEMVAGYANFNVDEPLDEEKKLQASHVVTLELDDEEEVTLSSVGDFAEQVFSLGYAITVHKAQGCEWRKVFLILHEDHGIGAFLTRELLYTAVTRAREKLVIIAKPHVLERAIRQQSIKGHSLEEKIQSINSGAQNIGAYPVTK